MKDGEKMKHVVMLDELPSVFSYLVPSRPTSVAAVSRELTTITLDWKPPSEPRGLLTNILYEVYYVERGAPPDNEMKLIVNNSVEYELKISSLKSDTMYMIKVRAGRKAIDGDVYWSGYAVIWVKTLQEGELISTLCGNSCHIIVLCNVVKRLILVVAPVISPEIIKVSSNGPRRIFVSWKVGIIYTEHYLSG